MVEMTQEKLIALLLEVEGGRPDSLGIRTRWHRNPEGPQAVALIAAKEAENAAEREKVEKLREALQQIAGYSEVNGMTRIRMRRIASTALAETQP